MDTKDNFQEETEEIEENETNKIPIYQKEEEEVKPIQNIIEKNLAIITIFLWINKIIGVFVGTLFVILYCTVFQFNNTVVLVITITGYSYTLLVFMVSYLKYNFIKERKRLYLIFNIISFLIFSISLILEIVSILLYINCRSPQIFGCLDVFLFFSIFTTYFSLLVIMFIVFMLIFDFIKNWKDILNLIRKFKITFF
jgi:hypothetical protein